LTPPPPEETRGKVICREKGCEIPDNLTAEDACPSCGGKLALPPTDWGEIFTEIVCHTNISYSEIGEMTIPALEAIMRRLGLHINVKRTPNLGFSDEESGGEFQDDDVYGDTVEERMAFAALFSG
jgi:hypothetical protein